MVLEDVCGTKVKKLTNIRHIDIYNNPLNPKSHVISIKGTPWDETFLMLSILKI